jgi:GntR family transcriptional regulator of arabinose operon
VINSANERCNIRMKELPPKQFSSNSGLPLYRQVEQYLREQISSGALRSGEVLPSVRELCQQFGGINHLTVRQALKNLIEENLIRSVKGRGCFVTEHATRTPRIAIVLPHLEDAIFVRIAKGAQGVLEINGVQTLILDSRGSETTEALHLQTLATLPVDGAIIFPITHGNIAEQIFKLKMVGFCFVLVDRYFEDIATPCVMADSYKGGYDSVRHLVQQGRHRVAWIGETRSSPARLRLQGIQAALSDAVPPCPGVLIKDIEIAPDAPIPYHEVSHQSVHRAVDELLEMQPPVDAIICSEDDHALSALAHLQTRGVEVPQQIALIGFDDVPEAALSRPALTTVRQPMIQIGEEAARMLLERIKRPDSLPQKKVLPVELVIRETA